MSSATIIVLYLLPEAIAEITPKLMECLQRGAKIIANTWGLKHLQPVETRVSGPYRNVPLMVYTAESIPREIAVPSGDQA